MMILSCATIIYLIGVTDAVQSAAMFALVVGSALHEEAAVPDDHPIIASLINSAVSSGQTVCGDLLFFHL